MTALVLAAVASGPASATTHTAAGVSKQFTLSTALSGVTFKGESIEGCAHDMRALQESGLKELLALADAVFADKGYKGSGYFTPRKKPAGGELTDAQREYNAQISAIRAPGERAIANIKVWRILHTDYRRPLRTFQDTFHAVIGLYWFKINARSA